MVADKEESRMGTKDRVFWKLIGKYGDIMNDEKGKKEKGCEGEIITERQKP